MFIDHCLPDDSFIGLIAFCCSRDARHYGAMPKEQRQEAIIAQLARLTQREAESRGITRYHEFDWGTEPFSRGCYVGVMGPGVLTHHAPLVDLLRQPHGNVHFAGTELSPIWCGYMEGAVRSGRDAAARLRSQETAAGDRGRPDAHTH